MSLNEEAREHLEALEALMKQLELPDVRGGTITLDAPLAQLFTAGRELLDHHRRYQAWLDGQAV